MQESLLGKKLDGRYKVTHRLAVGGFGQTYIAEDIRRPGHPKCVVKLLKPACNDAAFLENARRLFVTEAETLERLGSHEQVPRLLAYFVEGEDFYLVQEYIDGTLLTDELCLGKCWPLPKAVVFVREVLQILRFIHSQNVIHRDIKPDNIIRRRSDDRLALVDFGTVKQIRTRVAAPGQATATIAVGTPGYMPTEQSHGKPRTSSDIYALGVIAIQAITGLRPNQLQEDEESGELIWQAWAKCDSGLVRIIEKMVRYHFRDRYRSASEALQELELYIEHYPELAQALSPASPVDRRVASSLVPQPTAIAQPLSKMTPKAPAAIKNSNSAVPSARVFRPSPVQTEAMNNGAAANAATAEEQILASRTVLTDASDAVLADIHLAESASDSSEFEMPSTLSALGFSLSKTLPPPFTEMVVKSRATGDLPTVPLPRSRANHIPPTEPHNERLKIPSQVFLETEGLPAADDSLLLSSQAETRSQDFSLREAPPQLRERPRPSPPRRHRMKVVLSSAAAIGILIGGGLLFQKRSAFAQAEQSLVQAQQLQAAEDYESCVVAARVVSRRYAQLHSSAQNTMGNCWLAQAETLAADYRLKEAIAAAENITVEMDTYSQAEIAIPAWSKEIFQTALNNYKTGRYEEAKSIIQAIPPDSELKEEIAQALDAWQAEWQKNAETLAMVREAVDDQRWQAAIDEATKVTLMGESVNQENLYWKENLQPIVSVAEAGLTAAKEAAEEAARVAAREAEEQRATRATARPAVPTPTYRAPSPSSPPRRVATPASSGGWRTEQR